MGAEAIEGASSLYARRTGTERRRTVSADVPVPVSEEGEMAANSDRFHGILWRTAKVGSYDEERPSTGSAVMLMTDDTEYRALVGHSIRLARRNAGLSQEALGLRLEVSQREISRWERGVHIPSVRYQRRLCEVLDITPAWLHGEHD